MQRFIDQIAGMTIKSIRASRSVGTIVQPIINPHSMTIEAFYVQTPWTNNIQVLFSKDIREMARDFVIIDDENDITDIDGDLVRLKELIDINFSIIDKNVISDSKRKIGKATNYTVNDQDMSVQKIFVIKRGLKSFASAELIIGRNQIAEVTDKSIIIKEATISVSAKDKRRNKKPILDPGI